MPEFDVGGYLASDALVLHGVRGTKYPGGKTYTIPAPSAEDELRMRRITQLQDTQDDGETTSIADELTALLTGEDGTRLTVPQKLLGDVHQQMLDDGVTPTHIDRLTSLVMTNYGVNEYSARLVVAQAEGEAAARGNRATRRAAAKSKPAKPRASKPRAGSNLSRASGAKNTPRTPAAASTPGPATSVNSRAAKTA